jgi:hypothetical protein
MEWLQALVFLAASAAIGYGGYLLLGSGYRNRKPAPTLTENAPEGLTLTAIGNDRWRKSAAANALVAPFLQRGLTDGGCYSVRETPGTIIQFLVKEEEGIVVSIFEDAKGTHWVEISTFYDDGSEWLYSNQVGDGSVHRPGSTRYFAPKLAPEALYAKHRMERVKKKTRKVTANNVDAEYATVWAAHQKWLREQGRAP